MKIQTGCRTCIEHQLDMLSSAIGKTAEHRSQILAELTELFHRVMHEVTPPELAAIYYRIFERETGIADPFKREKALSTELALRMLPELRKAVGSGEGAFARAVLLAIGGNVIDYGATPDFTLDGAEKKILQVLDFEYDHLAMEELRRRMEMAQRIIYILDNCGEAVIDRLLIERYPTKITIAVRGRPILNDVTRTDALASGLDFVPIIDTGDNTPGVSLKTSSPEFVRILNAADLIIAKGQGNLESLADDFHERPVFYLFRTKCPVICDQLGVQMNTVQILGRNLI